MESQLISIIGKIYDAGERDDWNNTLNEIADFCQAEAANIHVFRPRSGAASVLSPRSDPELIAGFFENDLGRLDPTYPATIAAPVGHTISLADSGIEEFLSSPFYNEFWKLYGHGAERLRTNVMANADVQIGFAISPYAQCDELTPHNIETYRAVLPHVQRAFEMRWRMQRLEMQAVRAGQAKANSGTIVTNGSGRVLFADPATEAILAGNVSLRIREGQVEGINPFVTDRICQLIRSCQDPGDGLQLRGGHLVLSDQAGAELDVSIISMPAEMHDFTLSIAGDGRPAAMLIVQDQERSRQAALRDLQQSFGLTRAEAIVAFKCLKGSSRKAMAEELGLSESTVRSHLSAIFAKTGVKRRAQLVQLLFSRGFVD